MSRPVPVIRESLREELDRHRPPIFQDKQNHPIPKPNWHKAFVDLEQLPKIHLNTLGQLRRKE